MKKLLLIVMLFVSSLLEAGYEIAYEMSSEIQVYRYLDSKNSKIIMDSEDGETNIVKNKKSIYMLTYKDDGGIDVLDMLAMKKQAAQFGFDASQYMQEQEKPNFEIQKTSKRVNIAGVKGEVWIIHDANYPSDEGQKVIVTNDKKIVQAVKSMFNLFGEISGEADTSYIELQKGYVTIKAPEMELKYYKSAKVSKSEFIIPKGKLGKSKHDSWDRPKTKKAKKATPKLACYDSVCCSKAIGASVVLKNSLINRMNVPGDFTMIESATCSRTKDSVTEAAIYISPSELSRIYVTLKINTKDKGIIKESGIHYDIDRSYSERQSAKYKIYSATFERIKQEVAEVTFENNSILSFSRLKTENKPFYKWIDQYVIWSGATKKSTLSKNIQNYDFSKALPKAKDYSKNYKNSICNGKKSSKSKILSKYINKSTKHGFIGFTLFDVAKCKDTNTEEAIFIRRGGYETYKVVVNFNDNKGGVIKNMPRSKVKNYSTGSHYGDTYEGSYKGRYYSDYDLGNGISVSFSKNLVKDPLVGGWNNLNGIGLYSNIEFSKLMSALNSEFADMSTSDNSSQTKVKKSTHKPKDTSVNDAVAKEATKLFKSFF